MSRRSRIGLALGVVVLIATGLAGAVSLAQTGRGSGSIVAPGASSPSTMSGSLRRRRDAQQFGRRQEVDADALAAFAAYRQFLGDPDPYVRREMANAIAQRLIHGQFGSLALAAMQALENQLDAERDDGEAGRTMLRALGELPYDAETARHVEQRLAKEAQPSMPERPFRLLGAAEGLEAMIRHQADREIEPATRLQLRRLAVRTIGPTAPADPVLPALQALQAAKDSDISTILAATHYTCRGAAPRGCGWEFRRIAAQMMDPAEDLFVEPTRTLLKDPVGQVRIEALKAVAGRIAMTRDCQPLVDGFEDRMPVVAATAIDLVDPRCDGKDDITERLKAWAIELGDPLKAEASMLPMHALESLARFSPADAKEIATKYASGHSKALVRSAAARVAATVRDDAIALRLVADPEPKVRTGALTTLRRLGSQEVERVALRELSRLTPSPLTPEIKPPDVGSLWVALVTLKGKADLPMLPVLFQVLGLPETARIARLAALDRIRELAPRAADGISPIREQLPRFEPYLKPHPADPPVGKAVADIVEIATGKRPDVVSCGDQVPTSFLASPRLLMTMVPGDQIVLELNGEEALMTVMRFVSRVVDRNDRFAGTMFHRLLPNAVLQGGSREGSDWSGRPADSDANAVRSAQRRNSSDCAEPRFWLDEFNPLRHERGALALASNGRDTGIGQFFFDLVDLPAFNHEYTVFGRVACAKSARGTDFVTGHPMDLIDQFQEGEPIQRVEVPPQKLDLRSFTCVPGFQ